MSILDGIGKLFDDVADIPGDLVDAAASMFDGPGGVAGIFVSGTVLWVGGPGALVQAFIAGAAVTEGVNALIKTRHLSPEERTLAEMVFGGSLPAQDRIILTNLDHPQGRAFTIPNPDGQCLINLGPAYGDPIRFTNKAYPEQGQLLIHELTHVWQIHHSTFVPGLICDGAFNQIKNELEEGVYNPGDGQQSWQSYNLEQQATIVDLWYRGWSGPACSEQSPVYHHIRDTINGGTPPPAVQTMSVRNVAMRKFNLTGPFSVRTRFPRYKDGSLRKSLIGLRGF